MFGIRFSDWVNQSAKAVGIRTTLHGTGPLRLDAPNITLKVYVDQAYTGDTRVERGTLVAQGVTFAVRLVLDGGALYRPEIPAGAGNVRICRALGGYEGIDMETRDTSGHRYFVDADGWLRYGRRNGVGIIVG